MKRPPVYVYFYPCVTLTERQAARLSAPSEGAQIPIVDLINNHLRDWLDSPDPQLPKPPDATPPATH